jgi:hypothetical protein
MAAVALAGAACGSGGANAGGAAPTSSTARATASSATSAPPPTTASSAPPPSTASSSASVATLPELQDDETPLIRTDFSDDRAWRRVVAAVRASSAPYSDDDDATPVIVPVSDRALQGLTAAAATAAGRSRDGCGHVILADANSMRTPEDITVQYVDLCDEPGATFRAAADEVTLIEASLAVANLAFADFEDAVGDDGVFRGYPD